MALTKFNKQREESLVLLFESAHMTVHMIIQYLFKIDNKSHIIQYLINKLYREYRNDIKIIDFYLPQLCFLSVTKMDGESCKAIERFVLQMAIKYKVIGLKSLQWLSSWS